MNAKTAGWIGIICIFVTGIATGALLGWAARQSKIPPSIRISRAALDEIGFNQKCSGQQKDLAVNRKYVYANCLGGPVTVQNYEFK